MLADATLLSCLLEVTILETLDGEEFMLSTRRSIQTNEERLPKNFPALQERMDVVKRSNAEKQQLTSRSPLENLPGVEKDDSFFLL
jgi:hypothetical protein